MKRTLPTPPDFSFLETVSVHGWRRLLTFVGNDATQTLTRAEELAGDEVGTWRMREAGNVLILVMDKETGADERGRWSRLSLARRVVRGLTAPQFKARPQKSLCRFDRPAFTNCPFRAQS